MLKPSDVLLFQKRLDKKAPTKPEPKKPPEPPKGAPPSPPFPPKAA
jgi:hypothetical protein